MSAVIVSHPTRITRTTIELPASKSISNRALILQHLNPQITLNNLSDADDTHLMQLALRQTSGTIHVRNAGTCMRFLTALFASTESEITIRCDDRMKQRPIKPLVDALRQLGAEITYLEQEGYPPLKIKGKKLRGGIVRLDGSQSSQYISALLMVAPYFSGDSTFILEGHTASESYIGMTIGMMQQCGAEVKKENNTVHVKEGRYSTRNITIEPDWSAASYWYEIAALSKDGEIILPGLNQESLQGDAAIADYMTNFGVKTVATKAGIMLLKGTHTQPGAEWNMSSTPDLVPALAVTAAAMQAGITLNQITHLAVKETDRIEALKTELLKLGASVTATDDALSIHPQVWKPSGIPVNTYHDHRMAMGFAPLALIAENIMINDPGVVSKSYPGFWNDLERAGFILQQV